MSDLEYKEKYLKYKTKYINLKNEMGEQDGGLNAEGWAGDYIIFLKQNNKDTEDINFTDELDRLLGNDNDNKYIYDNKKNKTKSSVVDFVKNKNKFINKLWYWDQSFTQSVNKLNPFMLKKNKENPPNAVSVNKPIKKDSGLFDTVTKKAFKACQLDSYQDYHIVLPQYSYPDIDSIVPNHFDFKKTDTVIEFIKQNIEAVKKADNIETNDANKEKKKTFMKSLESYNLTYTNNTSSSDIWYGCHINVGPLNTNIKVIVKIDDKSSTNNQK